MTVLEAFFAERGIDYRPIAFYDSQKFLFHERQDGRFLEKYGQYVNERYYDREYILRARAEIPWIARILNDELKKDGRLGACVDISIGLNRILEREGFWNYIVKGSTTIHLPEVAGLPPKYFWSYDIGEFAAPHSWVFAPPFSVIDLSIKQQKYSDKTADYLPDFICSDSTQTANADEDDLISPEIRRRMELEGIEDKILYLRPYWHEFSSRFTPVLISENEVSIKYSPIGVAAADNPLEKVTTLQLSGRYAIEIYEDIIKPKLAEFRSR